MKKKFFLVLGFLCWVTCIFNWLNKTDVGFCLWNGQYRCVYKNCQVKVKFKVSTKDNENVTLSMYQLGLPNHTHKCVKIQLRNEERQEIIQKVRAEGVMNVRNELLCLEKKQVPSKHYYFVILLNFKFD